RIVNGKKVNVKWNWANFRSTKGFPVDDNLMSWVIGQDRALQECFLCLDEWAHKLKWLEKNRWYDDWRDPEKAKPVGKTKVSPGPYLLLLGDPGTGKSLIGRALAEKLTQIYKEKKIKLFDVLCWRNKIIPSEPRISVQEAGKGKQIIRKEKLGQEKKRFLVSAGLKTLQAFLITFGLILLFIGLYGIHNIFLTWASNPETSEGLPLQEAFAYNFLDYFANSFPALTLVLVPAGSLLFFAIFIWWFGRLGGAVNLPGIGGARQSKVPKMIVDNASQHAPFIDATAHRASQLFGDIAWDPYQTGGLGTPEHQRVTAGDVHRACLGILYIDEIKNLDPVEAITLLTVLEDGQLPITARGRHQIGGTAALAVSTEPVPCMCFLVGAGNFDSISQIHPALMDRIYGYGKVVRMNNDMPNTVENRRKYVQFIAQEVRRFHLIPFSREACEEIVDEGRRRSNKKEA
ncbi:AAA family ATPase, partial [Candidatus Bathyarchaeota archaeon]|nr:AAA family ATPase [Candidatus Bathyarchaeota archaeon]